MRFIFDDFKPSDLRPLRPSSLAELQRILTRNAERGMPSFMSSLDCSYWEWGNCPKALAGMYQNRNGKSSVVLATIHDQDLWIWSLFVGCHGSHIDLNVIHVIAFHLFVANREWPPSTFSYPANGTK